MIRIVAEDYLFKVEGIEIEGTDDVGVDVQYPWEDTPRRFHEHRIAIKPFDVDKYPVTNQEFKKFIDASHYHPKDELNFLKLWNGGTYPAGWANKPVTWVSQEDARSYAQWAGKRLPREWEWQYAAQGTDGRRYPWGNAWDGSAAPVPDKGRSMRGPDDVDAHPKGASPFGVIDMVGNVSEWVNACDFAYGQNDLCPALGYDFKQGGMACAFTPPPTTVRAYADPTIGFRCCAN